MILYTQLDLYKKNAYKQIALLREMFNKKEITKINWIENKFQIADCLIKYGGIFRKYTSYSQNQISWFSIIKYYQTNKMRIRKIQNINLCFSNFE